MAVRFPLVYLLFFANLAFSGTLSAATDSVLDKASELIEAGRYLQAEQLLREATRKEPGAAEAHFLLGFALAKQEQWHASKKELERAVTLDPRHGRAYTELAGVDFKLGNRGEAIRNLRRAEKLESDLEYVHIFLATLLYLEDAGTEALHYWNQVGAPRVDQISYSTPSTVAPELLPNLFQLNEGEIFRREQVLEIRWKQGRFGLGSPFSWRINPRAGGNYNLDIALAPRSVLSTWKLLLLENAVRAPLYKEVSIEYPLTLGSGKRVATSFRWDEPRKRVRGSARFPFSCSSSDSLKLGFDFRDENWREQLSDTEFLYEEKKALVSYEYLIEGRKSLELHGGYENQTLILPEPSILPEDPHFALLGMEWNQRIGLDASDDLRLQIAGGFDGFFGYGIEDSRSRRGQTAVELKWLFDRGSRSECRLSFGGGYASSKLPLGHYFILGIGQDDPLPLRAHPVVDRGRKGNSPMGRQYLLANLELRRKVVSWRVLEINGFLFGDTAMIDGIPFGGIGRQWFQDAGFGFSVGALGRERIEVLFGFDLKESTFNLWVGIPVISW